MQDTYFTASQLRTNVFDVSASWGDPLRNNSPRPTVDQIKHAWTSFTNKLMHFCNDLGQIKIKSGWRSPKVLMGISHSHSCIWGSQTPGITLLGKVGFTQPLRIGTCCWGFEQLMQMQLRKQNYARKWIYMFSWLQHSLFLLPSHFSQAKHAW